MVDLVDLNVVSLSLLFPLECQGYVIINPCSLAQRCVWPGHSEVQAAVLALLQLGMAGTGMEPSFSCPWTSAPLGTCSLEGMCAQTAPALYEEGLLSYKSLLFKH